MAGADDGGCPVVAQMATAATDAAVVAWPAEAGARIVGKTALTELCWSASGINDWLGTPVNPRDPRRLPGGSSSGSAVAVATGEADVALGTDTGGSVRCRRPAAAWPASRPAGRVPVKGVYPLALSWTPSGRSADVAAVELGMRLLEPGFTAPQAELTAGRVGVTGVLAAGPGDRGRGRPRPRRGRRGQTHVRAVTSPRRAVRPA